MATRQVDLVFRVSRRAGPNFRQLSNFELIRLNLLRSIQRKEK